jgi:hypothetical protein
MKLTEELPSSYAHEDDESADDAETQPSDPGKENLN